MFSIKISATLNFSGKLHGRDNSTTLHLHVSVHVDVDGGRFPVHQNEANIQVVHEASYLHGGCLG